MGKGPGAVTWVNFRWVRAAGLQNPYLITAHSVANTPHLSHFEKMGFLQSLLSHFCLCIYLEAFQLGHPVSELTPCRSP